VLSVLIVWGFLRSWGTTLVATVVIPMTLLVTILAMWLVGLSFDLMTLGGMAAAIGLVIDDAIVVVENIHSHVAAGATRLEAVHRAMREITAPIVFSTITPVVVFLPLSLLTGVTGVFFRSLALTMAVALLTSLVLALFFTPVLAQRFVTSQTKQEEHGSILRRAIGGYERLLEIALGHTKLVLAGIAVLLLLSYGMYRFLGSEFLPEFDEGGFIL